MPPVRASQSWSVSRFTPEQQKHLSGVVIPRRVQAGALIVRRGEPADSLFIVRAGNLKASVTTISGRETTFDILGPGDVFGEVGLFSGGIRTASVTALEACTLDVLTQAALVALIERDPMISLLLLGVLAERVANLTDEVEELTSIDAPTRLARSLVKLAERFGAEHVPQNLQVQLKLSQQDLADLVGLSRVLVNGKLRAWQSENILSHKSGRLTIHDLPALRKIAEEGRTPSQ